jgi:hypothetical protein
MGMVNVFPGQGKKQGVPFLEDILSQADQALYTSKSTGRNRLTAAAYIDVLGIDAAAAAAAANADDALAASLIQSDEYDDLDLTLTGIESKAAIFDKDTNILDLHGILDSSFPTDSISFLVQDNDLLISVKADNGAEGAVTRNFVLENAASLGFSDGDSGGFAELEAQIRLLTNA